LESGDLAEAVDSRLGRWQAEGAVERLWRRDYRLWADRPLSELEDRLGWLDLPRTMTSMVDGLEAFAVAAAADGLDTVVLLGMGGSSLGAEMLQAALGDRRRLRIADSTHPDAVSELAGSLDPETVVFVVSSKSGTTVETDSLLRFFWSWLERRVERPAERFVAVTDAGSALAEAARERDFRRLFEAPADVGGRYSVLGPFGLVPAALGGLSLRPLLESAATMAMSCAPGVAAGENPGLRLAALLGEAALAGRATLQLAASGPASPFAPWLEQLMAESTGKDGLGILPVPAMPLESAGPPGRALLVALGSEPVDIGAPPRARIGIAAPEQLGGEVFRWQVAVAMASAILGVHPFNQPDVQLAKRLAQRAVRGEAGAEPPRVVSVADADLAAWLDAPEGYCAVQAFLAPRESTDERLERLRQTLGRQSGMATTAGYGPRFLHSTGQFHKGGPPGGRFLQLVDQPGNDVEIPGAGLSFGRLLRAQADGDAAALAQRGRSLLRVDLAGSPDDELDRLVARVEAA
jgi:transaldolase/glucose-6-phosphate isomerase